MLTEVQINAVFAGSYGQAFNTLWAYFQVAGALPGTDFIAVDAWGIDRCKDEFCFLIRRFVETGRLRLAKDGVLLTGDMNRHISKVHDALPNNDTEIDMGGAGIWFFTEKCPVAAVWVREDGSLEWT